MQNIIKHLTADYYPGETEPGCAVLVVFGDKTQIICRGIANMETHAPIDSKTNFRLASVTKQFTAACLLQLRDTGTLRLDQSVTDFFPGFNDYGQAVTLEHLLRHTSGIKDYEKLLPDNLDEAVMDADVVDILARQIECDFPPGSRFRYSNSGYAILAMVVETVSGMTFPEYLRENIFNPLNMNHSLAYVNKPGMPEPTNRAIGYALNDTGEFVWADQNLTTAVLGDGGIYCSAADYEKWIRAYLEGRILKPETVTEAWTSTVTSTGETVPYGYGWRLEQTGKTSNRPRPYHPGSTSGFRNGVIVDDQKQWAVLVLSNRCNGDAMALAGEIAQVMTER